MALTLYICRTCYRRDDDPDISLECITGYRHDWRRLLGDGPERKEEFMSVHDRTVAEGCYVPNGAGQRCVLDLHHKGDHQFVSNRCPSTVANVQCDLSIGHEGGHSFRLANPENVAARQIYKGGAAATKIPGFKYIPLCALERLAKRFELGLERHGRNSWNALNPDSASMLDDKEWLIERLSHVIYHAYKEIERLTSDQKGDSGDDNAAAIMWGGACLIAADERRKSYVAAFDIKNNPEKSDR